MMARVRFTVDKSQKDDDEPIVEVTLKDGRSWREHVPMPLGAPTNPVTDEALLRKFRGVVGMVFTEEETEELARTLMALEEVSDFRTEVASLLAREPRTREQFDA
ncbi:MAG: hypothetical protein ACLT0O_06525 [Sutterella wadsworthensis]